MNMKALLIKVALGVAGLAVGAAIARSLRSSGVAIA